MISLHTFENSTSHLVKISVQMQHVQNRALVLGSSMVPQHHQEALSSIVISKGESNQWIATHVPSGRKVEGRTTAEAYEAIRNALGLALDGHATEPLTSPKFTGFEMVLAKFIEGPISEMLSYHAGWARLVSYDSGIASIKLGGGCDGCPSRKQTLFQGVKSQLQHRFGEDKVSDVVDVHN
jgi:Fe-S cluster biogenesis protein NfuA